MICRRNYSLSRKETAVNGIYDSGRENAYGTVGNQYGSVHRYRSRVADNLYGDGAGDSVRRGGARSEDGICT